MAQIIQNQFIPNFLEIQFFEEILVWLSIIMAGLVFKRDNIGGAKLYIFPYNKPYPASQRRPL